MAARPSARARCEHCRRPLHRFGRCRRRDCPGYRDLWAGDWRTVLNANIAPMPGVALVTITAPGADAGLAWDTSKCSHPPTERCSGPKGCRVIKRAADRWHHDHQRRAAALHRAAAARARRIGGPGPLIAAKTWERQSRGVDHLHLVVPYSTPSERRRAHAYVRALKELAPRYWFGYCDLRLTWGERNGGARAAGYCAKYIGKATWEESSPDVRRPVYVGQFRTKETGVTMRACRYRRFLWVVCRQLGSSADPDGCEWHLTPAALAALIESAPTRGP